MNLFFRKYGSGNPLVFLHGLLGMSDHWVSIARDFETDYTVYIPDLRNHGRSPHSETFNYKVMCDDLNEMFEQNNITEAAIIGHSMGGKLAMQFTDAFPDSVKQLVVADIGIKEYPSKPFEELLDRVNSMNINFLKNRRQAENILAGMKFEKGFATLLLKNIIFDAKGTVCWKFDLNTIRMNLKEIHRSVHFKKILAQPTLFIYGGQSDFIGNVDVLEIKRNFFNIDFVKMEHATHWLHVDDPTTFITEIKAFLKT